MTLPWFKLKSGIVPSAEKVFNRKENPKETRQAGSQSGSFKKGRSSRALKKVKETVHTDKKA